MVSLKKRTGKLLSGYLAASLLFSTVFIQPAMAKTVVREELPSAALAADDTDGSDGSDDITFSVRAGDLLIAVNPVAWEKENEKSGKATWNTMSESIGTIDTNDSKANDTGISSFGDSTEMEDGDGHLLHCATMEKKEKEKAWFDAHPEALKGQAAGLSSADGTEYKPGDWIWHGYDDEEGKICADEYMEGASIYKDNVKITTTIEPEEQMDGAYQVYRRYKCLAVGGKEGEGYTIWGYVPGSETNKAPVGDKKGHGGDLLTYLSQNRAEKIVEELEDMDFMDKFTDYVGDYDVTDGLGDRDGRVAFFFEPIKSGTLGFSYFSDQAEKSDFFDPAFPIDCLHIQLQTTVGDADEEAETAKFKYTEETGIPPYATMAHELTHYVVSGFEHSGENISADGWINEWFAQAIMMMVIRWNGEKDADKTIWDDVNGIVQDISQNGIMRVFAGPTDPEESLTYPISTLACGFYSGRMGDNFYKDAIKGSYFTENRLAGFLQKREGGLGKGLNWWRSAFCISILSNADGKKVTGFGDKGEFELNPFVEDQRSGVGYGSTHTAVCNEVVEQLQDAVTGQESGIPEGSKPIIYNLGALGEDIKLPGGGSSIIFKVDNDYAPVLNPMDITIKNVGEDIVWAHKTASGKIEVDGMPENEEIIEEDEKENKEKKEEQERKHATRNADGSWNYTDAQCGALEMKERPEESRTMYDSSSVISMRLFARTAISYNGNKKRLAESIIDLSKSSVSINGFPIRIKKVVVKNPRKAYISSDSIFRETISENNLSIYASVSEKKKPGYYLVLDKSGLTDEIKMAVSLANRDMRKRPIPIDILPISFTKDNVMVEYDKEKGKVKKLVISNGGTVMNLKANSSGKKDFQYYYSDSLLKVTGTRNFNGAFYYDPEKLTCSF